MRVLDKHVLLTNPDQHSTMRSQLWQAPASHEAVLAILSKLLDYGVNPKWLVEEKLRKPIVELLSFFADRLKVQLREQGARHDLVDAVFALEGQDDLLMVVRRVEALGKFLDTDDGKNLLAGTKRAANILRIEEKKDNRTYDGAPDPALYSLGEEKALAKAIDQVKAEASAAVAREDFASAMSAMAKRKGARKSPEAFERNPRRHPRGGGFFQDTGLAAVAALNEHRVIPRCANAFAHSATG